MREGRYAKSPNENQEKYCRANTLYKVCRKKEGFFSFSDNFLLREMRLHPEFCKGLSKKCPEHRINRGVPGIFEMHGNVVFSSLF